MDFRDVLAHAPGGQVDVAMSHGKGTCVVTESQLQEIVNRAYNLGAASRSVARDVDTAIRLKAEGKAKAAEGRRDLLNVARGLAMSIALRRDHRTLTCDDVMQEMTEKGLDWKQLGKSSGSLFAEKHWQSTGEFVQSNRVSRHRGAIMVWRLCL